MSRMNANVKNLPHLLALLDDPSPVVREALTAQLTAFGPDLDRHLHELSSPPTPAQRELIRDLLAPLRREALRAAWPACLAADTENAQIEAAYQAIANYQASPSPACRLSDLLDQLAADYRAHHPHPDPESLATYLFKTAGFRGAYADYYRPENSDLVHVIHHRRGIPLSLASMIILIGQRVGLSLEGVNFPGHFLARFRKQRDYLYIDGFDNGRILTEADLITAHGEGTRSSLRYRATSRNILERMLRNLNQAYRKLERSDDADLMAELMALTRAPLSKPQKNG